MRLELEGNLPFITIGTRRMGQDLTPGQEYMVIGIEADDIFDGQPQALATSRPIVNQ